ncbi:ExbD/TolR family protein [Fulvivirga sedimenti]|jgi:biopolymer transport protein ExbD|uniref:Biopolymer transporter ExbD n=1 Tax=Fulvivirga sedimenti TaxID=2879465 RepID=A0A9X1HSH3_9BACT|nr:biopolymer transporter ExbD [Fulvivirga sedimenti]MCA6075209.1 biopolymer transporter ExbD [Fulvivirga sedimenti]MCA6076386.1 biopolymer transporter ExbD [Fulvivirga sedimenti]MCA6077514.1 biopolymer transporter ExbD [Fulvivirga sedimenti]
MSKFKKKANTKQEIPTSALPDIIFMLLFFFMVTTVLREVTINVKQRIPEASQLRKLERKSLVSYLYVGEPKKTEQWGSEPRIQANDQFIEPKDVILWVSQEKDKLDENERDQITIAMKVDKEAKRGLISDIELQLRKANARKLLYTTLQETE